jgi:desulfoferrodoxin (superoxide reductase-like protein)
LKPFEGITADQVNRIEFINTTITSDKNESGRTKMAYKSQDIEKILNYLKSIKVSEYNKEIRNPDFIIGIIDNNDKEKHYIANISVSKNSMFIYQNELRSGAKYADSNVFNEIKRLYSEADYSEELLYEK